MFNNAEASKTINVQIILMFVDRSQLDCNF